MIFKKINKSFRNIINKIKNYNLLYVNLILLFCVYFFVSMYLCYRRSKFLDMGSDFLFMWFMFCYFDFIINIKVGVKDYLKVFCIDLKVRKIV